MKKSITLIFLYLVFSLTEARQRTSHEKTKLLHSSRTNRKSTHSLTHMDTEDKSPPQIYGMRSRNLTSGEDVTFKCKVDKRSRSNIQFTWFKDDFVISHDHDHRFVVTSRPWGSKLRIKSLYTLDTGVYKCVATDGERSLQAAAFLSVSFERPPPLNKNEILTVKMPNSKCEKYKGVVCRNYLHGKNVFIDAFQDQTEMESEISQALKLFSQATTISSKCQKFALPAFCYFVFPQCDETEQHQRLCREDCNILKSDICQSELIKTERDPFVKALFETANCSLLSSSDDSRCSSLGILNSRDREPCFYGNGTNYRGRANTTALGLPCLRWPEHLTEKFYELNDAENYCRNPGGMMKEPWCYIGGNEKASCGLRKCDVPDVTAAYSFLTPAECIGFLLLLIGCCFLILSCVSRRNKKHSQLDSIPEITTISRIDKNAIRIFTEIGNWKMGKVYQGVIQGHPQLSEKQTFAFQFLDCRRTEKDLKAFKREIDVLSKLNHPRITNLKALSLSATPQCVVFEYSNQVDMCEYLLLNSPRRGEEKQPTSGVFKFVKPTPSHDWLTNAALQITSGMEYLNRNNFIHRDLAARNILVCGNMELKISNLGVVREPYLSCYHQNEQGNLMPIRWMAPESIQSGKFSDKSTVWSFGILLWEMFNYGSQPYCGYSNQEVLEMVPRGQLLTCPDQCPAKMYSLMQECWSLLPQHRPSFMTILERLQRIENNHSTIIVESYSDSSINRESQPNNPQEYDAPRANLNVAV